ncbi:MAG TPA: hypothetical protein VMU59_14240 [Caulobacteraceae bacterium]|nr:hypothetical protein [Caulobacteraceae bacterium]
MSAPNRPVLAAPSRDFLIKHTRLGVLSQAFGDVLSDFEQELVEEIARRRAAFGDEAPVTPAEQAVVLDALEGIEAHVRRLFHPARQAFLDMLKRAEPLVGRVA